MNQSFLARRRQREIEVTLPTLHVDQVNAWNVFAANRFTALRCGRRWGKTDFDKTIAADTAIKGFPVGWFAPDYKIQSEAWAELSGILDPVARNSNKTEGVMRLITGGRIDFWTLENPRAGRSRKYKLVIVDEAAFTKPDMPKIWKQNIRPTLVDLEGKALASSNTNGEDADNWFWQICNEKKIDPKDRDGWVEYHARTHSNPYLPRAEVDDLVNQYPPLVYLQEFEAEFVNFSGAAFFAKDKWLVDHIGCAHERGLCNGRPVELPTKCDAVFAVIDSGTKTGKTNDGTGCVYYVLTRHGGPYKLIVADWDLQQIEGALLVKWLPTVFVRLEELARRCGARSGSGGALIEDKDSGQILLQQAIANGWPVAAIDSVLTSHGKDQRAINVSKHHYQEQVKICREAYEKVVTYKGQTRNHLESQVVGFRPGDPKAATREDDLLDGYTYGIACSLGNPEGFG